eukprot:962156_1
MKKKSKKQLKNTQLHVKKQKQASKRNRKTTGHKTESDHPAIANTDQTNRLLQLQNELNEVEKNNRECMRSENEVAKTKAQIDEQKAQCDVLLKRMVAAECKVTQSKNDLYREIGRNTHIANGNASYAITADSESVMELRLKVLKHEDEMKAMVENENAKREQMRLRLLAKSKSEKDALNIRLNAMETKMYLIQNECKSLRMQNEELQA